MTWHAIGRLGINCFDGLFSESLRSQALTLIGDEGGPVLCGNCHLTAAGVDDFVHRSAKAATTVVSSAHGVAVEE